MQKSVQPGFDTTTDIFGWTSEELQLAQAKITYLGEQTRPVPTVVFSTEESAFPASLEHFLDFQQSSKAYGNDRLSTIMRFTVAPEVLRRMISNVRVTLTGKEIVAGTPFLSFTLVRKVGNEIQGREFLISRDSGTSFYQGLISAFDVGTTVPDPLLSQFKRVYPK